ncbi:Zn-ribbon domain-containing OB-fold protein [Xanthobacter aminoxidans]|uniref:Zn-ribbon domain-containing OB-fold protein n=1 Tax=Xanthobacter aminoxidans TaxID=186280 RepID=UPI00372C41ED
MSADMDPQKLISPALVEVSETGAPHLKGGRCRACGALSFPKAAVCTECLSLDVETVRLPDEGRLYSYSIVHQAPKGWDVPYVLGYVDLPDGVRVLAHIDAPPASIAIDQKVRLSVGVVGAGPDGAPLSTYTFTPA